MEIVVSTIIIALWLNYIFKEENNNGNHGN